MSGNNSLNEFVDFQHGATVTAVSINADWSMQKISEITISNEELKGLVEALSNFGISVVADYRLDAGYVTFDIPVQLFKQVFLSGPVNLSFGMRSKSLPIAISIKCHQLHTALEVMPHAYRVRATSVGERGGTSSEHEPHFIDVSEFRQRGIAIGIATYIDAMLECVVAGSGKSAEKMSFSQKIVHCRDNDLLTVACCARLDLLRDLRNNAAHEFECLAEGEQQNHYKVVRVPGYSESFLANVEVFVAQCEQAYGALPGRTRRLYLAANYLAGEINAVAKLESVFVLGVNYPEVLESYFD